ncbi:Acyl-CoA synthetase (AMP-forming)/AMP-acid ligase II [Pseudonocardia ammonioxydans]|uniref:Acyl-CoA synthetase (AMP-forming)/AMP-acid ligase II n=1 Tax=Pseudonocardia ammonioxydans TaxID=260086 RepID=A0A1I4WKC5_PSUAM|nr:long-chain-fatty-acid--CoA ligase [Pseudonocardia ammonioxydans]SFN13429.1 Acyl-CoA synthetase (AMP-forming)/AMP-acid ligase II [Pseudonocardia ammonioxydans]
MIDPNATVSSLLRRHATERPDDEALRFGDVRRTWSELDERVRRLATALRAEGIGPGDRVAVLDLNHPSCLELSLACAWIGAANAVVNFRLAPPEILYVINDARARLLLVGPEFAGAAAQLREKLDTVERILPVGGEQDEYEAFLSAHQPDESPHPAARDDCFVQLYTSGTTGFPKGAMLTHGAMLAHAAHVATDFELAPTDVVQVAMPLFHVGGTSYAFLALGQGARIVMARMPDPAALLDMIGAEGITHTFWVPALMGAMTQVPGAAEKDYSSLRAISYGASPMPLPVLRASLELFGPRLHQVYGMTEACGVVTSLGPEDHADPAVAHRLVSAGKPITGVTIEVRDPATGEELGVDEPGEIWVRTDQLMSGYWQKPEATAAAVTPDGWLRSGDGGHIDADGYVYVTDRIKDMIVSGGENVYPAEIERVLAEHPSVADVAVIGVPDERWGEVPKACVVAAPGATIDPEALLARAREHLAGFKCPRTVDVLEELPRNPTGKILKKELRAPHWEGRERRTV